MRAFGWLFFMIILIVSMFDNNFHSNHPFRRRLMITKEAANLAAMAFTACQAQPVCIDRMHWCVNREHGTGICERKRKDEAEHNGFPMYRASAGRNTTVKYLSLSSRDNARANWNLLRETPMRTALLALLLRSQDRFTLILPTFQRVPYYSRFVQKYFSTYRLL